MKTGIRLLGEDFQHVKWIDPRTRLTMLAEGTVDKVYKAKDGTLSTDATLGHADGTVKLRTRPSSEIGSDLPSNDESRCSLTCGDMLRNAAGLIDTPKRHLIYRARKDGLNLPAYIRCYGHDAEDKPRSAIVGNLTDISMSRVEQWASASETNKAVTIVPGAVLGITERELDRREAFVL